MSTYEAILKACEIVCPLCRAHVPLASVDRHHRRERNGKLGRRTARCNAWRIRAELLLGEELKP